MFKYDGVFEGKIGIYDSTDDTIGYLEASEVDLLSKFTKIEGKKPDIGKSVLDSLVSIRYAKVKPRFFHNVHVYDDKLVNTEEQKLYKLVYFDEDKDDLEYKYINTKLEEGDYLNCPLGVSNNMIVDNIIENRGILYVEYYYDNAKGNFKKVKVRLEHFKCFVKFELLKNISLRVEGNRDIVRPTLLEFIEHISKGYLANGEIKGDFIEFLTFGGRIISLNIKKLLDMWNRNDLIASSRVNGTFIEQFRTYKNKLLWLRGEKLSNITLTSEIDTMEECSVDSSIEKLVVRGKLKKCTNAFKDGSYVIQNLVFSSKNKEDISISVLNEGVLDNAGIRNIYISEAVVVDCKYEILYLIARREMIDPVNRAVYIKNTAYNSQTFIKEYFRETEIIEFYETITSKLFGCDLSYLEDMMKGDYDNAIYNNGKILVLTRIQDSFKFVFGEVETLNWVMRKLNLATQHLFRGRL